MKQKGIQNGELIKALASINHKQTLVVCDVGLPIPKGVQCIDLALVAGYPSFTEVLNAVCGEFVYEAATFASELKEVNPQMAADMEKKFSDVEFNYVPHDELKEMSKESMVIIRTGETKAYFNVVLRGGVNF